MMPRARKKKRQRLPQKSRPRHHVFHVPIVVVVAGLTVLAVILSSGTGLFRGDLSNAPDAVMYLDCPDSGQKGTGVTCTVTTKNEGRSHFSGLVVTLTPLELVYVSASVACEEQRNKDVVCSRKSIGAVNPGKQDEFTITFTISTACPIEEDAYLTATAKIAQRENNTRNNTKVEKIDCT